jgi:Lrp/AsnC family transcriptional regulator, leucine-responsive regulatory protein
MKQDRTKYKHLYIVWNIRSIRTKQNIPKTNKKERGGYGHSYFTFKMDSKDRRIIQILQEDGDLSTRQIAKKAQLPITTVHNRVKKLKQQKVIKRFTIDVDEKKIGQSFTSHLLISVNLAYLKKAKKTKLDIANALRGFKFTERADLVAGSSDIMATIRVTDVVEFDKVLSHQIQMIDGVRTTESLIVIN